ncbi:MAG: hypothetical protein M1827_003723 [Pycnora praestabilis]|nr:MAG: hypothetical protein M1827_003723 [Pycnora praestabilis]
MPFQHKTVLVIGATSGIGEALATKLVEGGSKVIVVGRRQEKLDEFVKAHGKDKASSFQFDITQLDKISQFAAHVTKAHPELDCVMLNSGIQRGFDFSDPASIDHSIIEEEFKTNYLSYLQLTTAFLPHLQAKSKSALVYTTSGLALVPITRCANYCASKAALHHFILVLRQQLKAGPVQVIELFPPAVRTELHDEKHQPDIKNGRQIGMPLDQFTNEAYAGLESGADQIPVGNAKDWFDSFEPQRQEKFMELIEMMR